MFGVTFLPTVFRAGRRFLYRQGVRSLDTIVNGIPVHYLELCGGGKGLPILLVHGLAGSSLSWGRCMVALSKYSSRIVAPDLPGAGKSPLPTMGPLRYEAFIDLIASFADQVMPETFILAGASMGAAIVTRALPRIGGRVKALALVVPGGARVPEERVSEQLARLTVNNKEDARALVSRLFATQSPVREWALADDAYQLYNQPWVQAIIQEAANGSREMTLQESELASIQIPTALYWAKEERLLLEDGISYFKQHLPREHAEIEEIDNVGHSAHIEKPSLIAQKMITFFTKKQLHRHR